MLELKIIVNSVEELMSILRGMPNEQETVGVSFTPEATPSVQTTVDASPVAEEKPKRTRRTKAEMEAVRLAGTGGPTPIAGDHTAVEDVIEPTPAAITRDDAYIALQKVFNSTKEGVQGYGLHLSRDVLSRLGCNRFSEVKDDQYSALVELCNAALSEGQV